MNSGLFVTFEGIDGCGKTTQVRRAADFLCAGGYRCLITREPGGTAISENIREMVMDTRNARMSDRCELLLYLAARAQHVEEVIMPALDEGKVVLCDRFADATFAYQGYGRGMDIGRVDDLNEYATDGCEPALTFLFDISPERARVRMSARGKEPDRIESEHESFGRRIREGYLDLAARHPDRIITLDAARDIESLADTVNRHLVCRLEKTSISAG